MARSLSCRDTAGGSGANLLELEYCKLSNSTTVSCRTRVLRVVELKHRELSNSITVYSSSAIRRAATSCCLNFRILVWVHQLQTTVSFQFILSVVAISFFGFSRSRSRHEPFICPTSRGRRGAAGINRRGDSRRGEMDQPLGKLPTGRDGEHGRRFPAP